jgi:heavy metal sensor kinase
MKLSIRTRLAFSFTLIFMLCLIVFSGTVYYFMSSNLEHKLQADALHDSAEVLEEFTALPWDRALRQLSEESDEFRIKIQLLDSAGRSIYLTPGLDAWEWPAEPDVLKESLLHPAWSDLELKEQHYLVLTQSFTPPNKPVHYMQIAHSRADTDRIREQLIYCINIGTPLILIIVFLGGHLFSRKALEPVETIRARAETIKSDNLQERIAYDGPPDELSRLADTLNDLLGRIQVSFEQIKRFVADASHELRIPLTGIRGLLEVALRQDRSKEEYKKTIENAFHESERMSELVWDLLALARADAGELELDMRNVSLPTFFRNVFEQGEMLNAGKNIHLKLGPVSDAKAVFDEVKIHQLLLNLLENAIRYNKPGGEVVLSAERKENSLVVSVKDTGLGLSPDDQIKIFERFYRVDKARSREAGGTGLGLPIARTIAHAHKGTLTVTSQLGHGSEFILTLPQ